MPGRQAHGRPLLPAKSGPRGPRVSRTKASATALDAFGLAAESLPHGGRKHVRTRDLDPEPARKRPRHQTTEDGGGSDDDEDLDGPFPLQKGSRGMRRGARGGGDEEDGGEDDDVAASDYGSDSEGNEWRVGQGGGDDDSEIDSDEAFGEGDEERFEGFVFGGSSSKTAGRRRDDAEASDDEADGESLGEDAIDLADALDQVSGSEKEGSSDDPESGSEGDDESDSVESAPEGEEDEDDEGDEESKLKALKGLVSDFAGGADNEAAAPLAVPQGRAKISLDDLGLDMVQDSDMRKSLKLMKKEERSTAKPGSTSARKLDVPLARRQQSKLLRVAASETASKTLDRWTETVKHNRRAEHLFFPLSNQSEQPGAGLDNSELMPMTEKAAGATELEQSIMAIMQESGLLLSGKEARAEGDAEAREGGDDNAPDSISRTDLRKLWSQRRHDRELHSREQARAKKIKNIKSKAWHRVHRKERARAEMAAKEAMAAEGELDSEEEAEAQDRRRALERVGARHKDSKWAKLATRAGRAVWDEEFREGMKDMARKDEELRRRVEGRGGAGGGDDDDDDDDDDEDGDSADESDGFQGGRKDRLLAKLESVSAALDDGASESRLMKMPFMQRAEAALRRANDELVGQIRRDLASDEGSGSDEHEPEDIGRRSYGVSKRATEKRTREAREGDLDGLEDSDMAQEAGSGDGTVTKTRPAVQIQPTLPVTNATVAKRAEEEQSSGGAAAWSRKTGRKRDRSNRVVELDLSGNILLATKVAAPKQPPSEKATPKEKETAIARTERNADDPAFSDSEADTHLPLALRDQELVRRAFAGDDVVGADFARDKAAIAEDDEEKTVDKTLPGWGSWVGEGVSARETRRHTGRFVTTVAAVKKRAERRDTGLTRVIINERRVRKNEQYLASALPFPFENRAQYEASLRMPVGPEWMTKESFQAATKPRVLLKQGIIAPMAKPML